MKISIFSFALMIFANQCQAGDVSLNLRRSGDLIEVSVENMSKVDIKVSRLFTQNPAFGLIEFYAMVNGRRTGPVMPPNEGLPQKSDYIILTPFGMVGRAFYISDIRKIYGVEGDCFDLAVKYHDVFAKKFTAFPWTIKSNKLRICGSGGLNSEMGVPWSQSGQS